MSNAIGTINELLDTVHELRMENEQLHGQLESERQARRKIVGELVKRERASVEAWSPVSGWRRLTGRCLPFFTGGAS